MSNDFTADNGSRHVTSRTTDQNDLTFVASTFRRKWNPVIVAELLDGPRGFSELQERIDGISNKSLSESLADLEERELIDRTIISERPFRVEYSLTERAQPLEQIIAAIRENEVELRNSEDSD